ncbi:hypothetical protein ACRRTK_021278 [Alexandromys fortis]
MGKAFWNHNACWGSGDITAQESPWLRINSLIQQVRLRTIKQRHPSGAHDFTMWSSKHFSQEEDDASQVPGHLLDKLRKNGFASVIIFGNNNSSSISGVWVFHGLELNLSAVSRLAVSSLSGIYGSDASKLPAPAPDLRLSVALLPTRFGALVFLLLFLPICVSRVGSATERTPSGCTHPSDFFNQPAQLLRRKNRTEVTSSISQPRTPADQLNIPRTPRRPKSAGSSHERPGYAPIPIP